MSSEVSEPLLPVLEQSRALRPLIVVLAVLPGFIALERHGMDDFSSVWALRALSTFQTGTVSGFVDPGEAGRTAVLSSQPPLATWLTAAVLAMCGPTIIHAPLIVPLLATAGCVWWTFRLFREVAGPRKGFWAAVLASTNGTLLLLATNTAPTALSLFLALVAIDAWLRHFRQRKGKISAWLLVSGLALGLCLLAGGPVVFAVFAIMTLKPLLARAFPVPTAKHGKYARNARKAPRLPLAVGVVFLTAFAIGGWWTMREAANNPSFWPEWWSGYETPTLTAAGAAEIVGSELPAAVARAIRMCVVVGPILPLCIYGFILVLLRKSDAGRAAATIPAGRESTKEGPLDRSGSPVLLVSWLIVAVVYHLIAPGWTAGHGTGRTLPDAFLLVPAVGLAAYAVDAILQRQTTVREVFLLTVAMFAVIPVLPNWELGQSPLAEPVLMFALSILTLTLLVGWRLRSWVREREFRKRVALGVLMTAQLAAAVTGCVLSLASLPPDDSRLMSLRAKLPAGDDVSQILLITDSVPPARLEYMLRSVNPNARWRTVGIRNVTAEVGEILAKTDPGHDVLFVEWISVGKQTALADIHGRKLVAVGTPRFYRGRDLRVSLLKPLDGTQ